MGGRVLFLPLGALYPECSIHLSEHAAAPPMACLEAHGCPRGLGARCMPILARRLGRLFDLHGALEHIVLHWQRPDGTCRGIGFDRALSPPRVATLRPVYLQHYRASGQPFAVPAEVLA